MTMVLSRLRIVFAALLLALLPIMVAAQDTAGPDYDAWAAVAERAEGAIEDGRASDTALEDLRSQIATWRQAFLTAQEANSARVATLRSQIKALGPVPAEGEPPEPEEIAARRAELTAQLSRLEAPIVKAVEAYSRANGIIGEIDQLIRERQTQLLFELGPTPLNLVIWPRAVEELKRSFAGLSAELGTDWQNPSQQKILRDRLPPILALGVLGLVLLGRGRRWMTRLSGSVHRLTGAHGFAFHFLMASAQALVPLAGILVLTQAMRLTGLGGPHVDILLDALPLWVAVLIGGQWLAGLIFGDDEADSIYWLGEDENRRARRLILGLTLLLALRGVMLALATRDFDSDEARAVIGLPLVLLSSILLFRLSRMLTAHWRTSEGEGSALKLLPLLGRGLMLTAIAAPVLAAVGYESAANALIYPAIRTLGPVGLVIVLQYLFAEAYSLLTGDAEGREALVPALMGYVLVLAALPFLALIWGARAADLSELWAKFQEGFTLGESRISPTDFLGFVLVFVIGYMVTRVLQGALRTSVLPKTKIDAGGQNAIVSGVGYVGIFTAAVVAISSAGIDLSSLAIVAGALSVGIGFGLQNIVSNFVSGIILLIERPISLGDWIEVGGKMGYVRNISVRSTRVETFDRTDLIIPNSDLVSGQVVNWTRGNLRGRVVIPVGVAYGTDTKKVEHILSEIARAHPMVSQNPEPSVYFQGFGASSLDFEIRAILKDVNWIMNVKSDINHEIARRFTEEDIEIPFNQSDITIRNLEQWLDRQEAK
jgi:small-conductance mechanosensitive channel